MIMEEKVLVAVLLFWIVMNWILAASEGVNISDVCQEKCNATVDKSRTAKNVREVFIYNNIFMFI